jgi:hypothetical protein
MTQRDTVPSTPRGPLNPKIPDERKPLTEEQKKSIIGGFDLQRMLIRPQIEVTEKEVAASILNKDEFLDKNTILDKKKQKDLTRLETVAFLLEGSWPGVDPSPIKFLCEKDKKTCISIKGSGRKDIVTMFKVQPVEDREKRTYRERLLGSTTRVPTGVATS